MVFQKTGSIQGGYRGESQIMPTRFEELSVYLHNEGNWLKQGDVHVNELTLENAWPVRFAALGLVYFHSG